MKWSFWDEINNNESDFALKNPHYWRNTRRRSNYICPWCLHQATKDALKEANVIRELSIDKTRRLLHVDTSIEVDIQKHITNIKMMQFPTSSSCNRKYSLNWHCFDNKGISLIVILVNMLMKALCIEESLQSIQHSIRVLLHLKHPSQT